MVLTESEFVSFYAYDTDYAPSTINNYYQSLPSPSPTELTQKPS